MIEMRLFRYFVLYGLIIPHVSWSRDGSPSERILLSSFPRLRLSTTTHDFNDTWPGQVLRCAFGLHNDGNADLQILRQKTTCGCTIANPINGTIAPGGMKNLDVSFAVGSHLGKVSKSVIIETNDPNHRQVVFTVTAQVRPAYALEPAQCDFGDMPVGSTVTKQVVVKRLLGQGPIDINDLPKAGGNASVKVLETTEQGCRVEVTFTSAEAAEFYSETLRLVSTDRQLPPIEIPVKAKVHRQFFVEPSRIFFGFVQPGQAVTRTLTVGAPKDDLIRELVIADANANPELQVRSKPDGENRYIAEITWRPTQGTGTFSCPIQMKLLSDKGVVETVSIPCLGLVRPTASGDASGSAKTQGTQSKAISLVKPEVDVLPLTGS